jgi:hypothetical protein
MLSIIEKNQRLKESNLSSLEAFRAIYIDFEGFKDMAPTFAGVLIEDSFEQVLFDIDLTLAGANNKLNVVEPSDFLRTLVNKAKFENRRIIGYSSHEKTVFNHFFGLDISSYYADARLIAKTLRKTTLKEFNPKPKTLTEYLHAIGYPKKDAAIKKTTSRINSVKKMLLDRKAKYGDRAFDELTHTVKGKWTRVLNHNHDDVFGMRYLVSLAASGK